MSALVRMFGRWSGRKGTSRVPQPVSAAGTAWLVRALFPIAVISALVTAGCGGGGLSSERPVGEAAELPANDLLEFEFPAGQPKEYRLPFRIPGFFHPYESRIEDCPEWVTLYPDQGILAGMAPAVPGPFFCTYTITEADPGFRPQRSVTYGLRLAVDPADSLTLGEKNYTSLSRLSVGIPHNEELPKATGGVQPHTYSFTCGGGKLPPGMSFTPETRRFAGTPDASFHDSCTYTVADSSEPAQTDSEAVDVQVTGVSAQPLSLPEFVVPENVLHLRVGGRTRLAFRPADGGVLPYTYELHCPDPALGMFPAPSTLPPGLGFGPQTRVLSGTPEAAYRGPDCTYRASYWEEGDRQTLQSLIDGARRLPPLPDRPDSRLLLRLTGPEALPELATEAAYPAEDGLRRGLEGLVLTIGDRRFPAAPVATAMKPAAAAPAIQLPSEARPEETVESVPATSGSIPESLLAVRDVRSTRTTIPALSTALPGDVPSSSAPPSGSSSRSDVLVLRTDPAQAILERSPNIDAPAVGLRWATSTDERLRRDAGADTGPVESAVPGKDRLRSGLVLVAPFSYSPDSTELHAPESATAKDWPGTDRKPHESGTDLASGLSSITAGNEEWEPRFGPGPAQSANAFLLTVPSDDAPSPPDDGSQWAPSSFDAVAHDSAADGATPEGAREVAPAPASGSRSATIEDEDETLRSGPGPTLVVNVAILNDYSNYDPFSAATASYRPFRLGSAVPQSDYALWDPVWMPQGGGTDPRTLILAAAQGHDDWLPQVADAAPPEPEPGDEWTVLLGTGQRLTLGVDAAAVAIASPEVADVQLLTPRVLFVMGRSLGRTTVSVLGEDGSVFERDVSVVLDLKPLRALLAGEPGLEGVQVEGLARGVALAGDVGSQDEAERALGLVTASLPEGILIENNLDVGVDLEPLQALLESEPDLGDVGVRQVGRGVALTGEVASAEAAARAHGLAVASLPEGLPVENNLRVAFGIEPLRTVLAAEKELAGIRVRRLPRGVDLSGNVDSQESADRALRLAAGSLPDGTLVEHNLDVGLDLGPLRALLAGEPGLADVEIQRVGRGVVLTGEVASAEAAGRAHGLAAASLPESLPVENNLRVEFDVEPLRAVLAAEPGLEEVDVRQLARGVALAGEVASPEAADRAYRLAAASLPEGLVVENNLEAGLDLEPLRALMSGEAGLEGVEVLRVGRGVALTGEVASADAADRAHRLAVAFLPESLPVENNLRVQFDIEPLRTVLGAEPGLEGIRVQRLARGVALAGDIASPEAAERARRLAVASLPEGLLVENNLSVVLDLAPLHALMVSEPGLEDVEVRRVGQGVALTGEVESAEASDRAHRLAMASLPESLPVENNLRVVFDVGPLRAILAGEPELDRVQVQELGRGVVLTGEVASAEAFERAQRIATASLPEGVPVENSLRVVPDIEHLRAALAGEPGLDRVQVQRLARGVALSGDVDSPAAEDRALRLAAASLAEGVPVENNLNVGLDLAPLRSLVAGEPGLKDVRVERTGRGVALIGEVGSAEVADQAARLAAALLPEDMAVENNLRVVWDAEPLRALLAGSPELDRVQVQRLARGVVLSGEVASHAAADLAFRLASASVPEGAPVENTLDVRLDLAPLRVLVAGERDLRNVRVKRVGRGVALSGEVGSAEASDRAHRLAVASLPEGVAVENGLRVAPDVGPLRVLLAGEPGLERVHVQKLARGVALAGDVASPKAADRALRLAAASLPEGMLVEDNLSVALDLAPLKALMAAEEDFGGIRLNRIGRGVALTGEVGSQTEAERAARLAAATLPESALVENNLRVVLDSGPLRAALAGDPEFGRVHVLDLEHGLSLNGEVSSAAAAARAHRLAAVSLPADTPVENNLRIAGPLQVNLEVQIAEVQRSIAEEFGFNWELFGRSAEGVLGGGFRIGRQLPPPLDAAGRPLIGRPGTIPTNVVDGLTSPSLILSRTWEEIGITGMVDALAKAGLANVLARPNVTANSGETASFFSGGEFPLPSGFKDGVIVFEYKKYGVVLDFVPTIVDDGRVELTVRPEVSEPSQDNSVQVAGGVSRVRLHGIDAPESEQLCCAGDTAWQCGQHATRALTDRVDGRLVDCEERDLDRYGRIVALCRAGGSDLGAWLVAHGWALAYRRYSDAYVSDEASAEASRRGLWRGAFVEPWDWRAGERLLPTCLGGLRKEDPAPSDCRIKGNIARDGERIYHLPGGKYYGRTRIDPAKGERWFCAEAEARAAGWRRSRR